ncbi:iron complex outermembrane recepter protein [Tistlia consotensis]|uniref:Iron complex outermembrane recepter protein n=1 Tax=Tistlia consotensis USBA 355 TaxID=560819 RepID=A0A1Y6CH55_9PROT|nr:TonB-dependent siderophore receptor [Tistlia consotensis]SMF64110.1 iron complex outermembrane recepter protein [Tistlia consotensis USBA 355]SNR97920.1 iron complex outermembrane recepter protein [Tistlia consotensis]
MARGGKAAARGRARRQVLAGALMMTALAPLPAAAPAWAQQAVAQRAVAESRPGALSALGGEHAFDIPAQPMTSALALFGQQAGLQVTVDGALVRGLPAPAVRGRMTAEQALDRLLAGSGLGYGLSDRSTVAVEKASLDGADGPTRLGPIRVQAEAGSPYGPVTGSVVASRSATADKTDTPLIDTPASVSVITQKDLETRNVQDLQQALAYTSSVSVDEYGSDDRYDFFRIRGFDQTSLGTYRDGLSMRIAGWTASRLEPYGLQQIDVLKGSTSSLFGLNGPGGLVNAITKRPPEATQGEIHGTFGEGHVAGAADFGGPLDAEGVWSYRLTALWQDGDHGADYSNDDRRYLAPALTFRPNDATSLTILTDYYERDGNAGYGFPARADVDPDSFLGEPDFNKFDTRQADVGYLFSHDFGNGLTVRQNARYTHLDLDYEQVYGGSTDPSVPREAFSVDGSVNRFGIDTQLQLDRSWTTVDSKTLVGFDYTYDNNRETALYGSAPGIDIDDPVYCGRSCVSLSPYLDWRPVQNAYGVYAQEQLTFDDRWIVTLGGRYDYVDTRIDHLDSGTSDATTASDLTKRAGLTYKVTDDLSLYGNYSESFQPLVGTYAVTGSLEPQEGTQYEAGVKFRPLGPDSLFTLAFFDLTQTNVPSYVSPVEQRQIGEVRTRGVEFEGRLTLDARTDLLLAYTYWDAEIVEDGIQGNAGNRPADVPRHLASLWIDHTIPGSGSRGDLTLGAGVRYVGSTFGDDANTVKIDSYAVVDAALDYRLTDHVSVGVNVTNLFDNQYVTTNYYGSVYYGDRRSVLGTLKYAW